MSSFSNDRDDRSGVGAPALDRRLFLRRGVQGGAALGLLGLSGGLLAACGDDGGTTTSASTGASTGATGSSAATGTAATTAVPKYGKWTIQMNWTAGSGWAGSYLAAEAGVYQKLGFDGGLDILYGGPNVAVEPIIVQGKTIMGMCGSETFAAAVRNGAKLVCVGAFLQKNPYAITSLSAKPITKAEDLIGKKIGIQAYNEVLWASLLKTAKIDASKVTKVIVQNDPTPLVNGEVDGFLSFINNQPITLDAQKIANTNLLLADMGFTLWQQLYVVTEETFKTKKDLITAGLKAELIGKQMAEKDPAAGVKLTVEKYAKDQNPDPAFSLASLKKSFELSTSDATKAKGLMYMTPEDIAKNVATLKDLGLEIPASSYSSAILDEIYKNGTNLL